MEDLLQVGIITTTHGVRGEVKVFPTTDDPARFKKLKNVLLDTGKEKLSLEIAGVKFFKNMVILKFKGIDNINDVEKYRKCALYVTRENEEILTPAIRDCIRSVDVEKGQMCIHLLPGLRDMNKK